jgi:hypothetical protein
MWRTFGTKQRSTVLELDTSGKDWVLGWSAKGGGATGYHRWILSDRGDGSTHVTTEEIQTGITPRLSSFLLNRGLHASHEVWLQNAKLKLEQQPDK